MTLAALLPTLEASCSVTHDQALLHTLQTVREALLVGSNANIAAAVLQGQKDSGVSPEPYPAFLLWCSATLTTRSPTLKHDV